MKQNKRRTATVVYIFIFMLTVSGCVRKGKEQDKVYQETGMFEWSEEAVCGGTLPCKRAWNYQVVSGDKWNDRSGGYRKICKSLTQ